MFSGGAVFLNRLINWQAGISSRFDQVVAGRWFHLSEAEANRSEKTSTVKKSIIKKQQEISKATL